MNAKKKRLKIEGKIGMLINETAIELAGIFRNQRRAERYKHVINTEAFLRSFVKKLKEESND